MRTGVTKVLGSSALAAAFLWMGCKPVQSQDTMVFNTSYGFVNKDCGADQPFFAQSQGKCILPSVLLKIAAAPLPGYPAPVLLSALGLQGAGGQQQPLIHARLGIDFRTENVDLFPKIFSLYGIDPVSLPLDPLSGQPRPVVRDQFYRVTDFHSPGIQALSGTLWTGPLKLTNTWSGAYAALSATWQKLEMPVMTAPQFLAQLGPKEGQRVGGSGGSVGTSFIKSYTLKQLNTLPADDQAKRVIARNNGLSPGDVLLVFRHSKPYRPAVPPGSGARPGAGSGNVKSLLAEDETPVEALLKPGQEQTACMLGGDLVHSAVLVEKDFWFETVLVHQGALFRTALFDDVVAHAQLRAALTLPLPRTPSTLDRLCFGVVSRDRAGKQGEERYAPPLPLPSVLKVTASTTVLLMPNVQAPGTNGGVARDYMDKVPGRLMPSLSAPGTAPLFYELAP